ncbi:MAG: metallophosphoesterase [Deltaproteobacteria bacterium]|nr:metallophosphoesterase [Deltaproteobacteria bacterium]MBW2415045.1 metallophosphoesterase [Deltaproteobacteria bacterium]
MRWLAGLIFLSVALGVLGSGHYYLATRLLVDPELPQPWLALGLSVLALGAVLIFAAPAAERTLPRSFSRWLAWPAGIWLGLGFLLTAALLTSDLVLWTLGTPVLAADGDADGAGAARLRAAVVGALALSGGLAGVVSVLRGPRIVRLRIAPARWTPGLEGLRIVQISDVHLGAILGRDFAARIVDQVNALEPDLIAITGDLVDGPVSRVAAEAEPFADLRARHGVFFVTGNHDHYSGADPWVDVVRSLGIRVLRNERVAIEHGGDVFDLAGVDDYRGGYAGTSSDLGLALEARDPARPVVLLAHDPSTFRAAAHAGVDLQLSGHTHGGQIWPFRYLVRLAVPWVEGLHRRAESLVYVSRGTGFWGPPMRLFAPAEITEITLTQRSEGAAVPRRSAA